MRHFRIKEVIHNDDNSDFIIQYTVRFLFITFWKKYNKIPYKSYDYALLETKKILSLQEYSKSSKDKTTNYHYIDAFNLDMNVDVDNQKVKTISTNAIVMPTKAQKPVIESTLHNDARLNKSTFVPNSK